MKIINVEQGSPEWHAWRKTVITATDCPAIRGSFPISFKKTPYKIWQRKLDIIKEQKSNYAMDRGKQLEPIIRERFIKKFGIKMSTPCVESSEYEFLGASLDGLSECWKYMLEIKTGGKELHDMAEQGIIPDYYMDQMQQQFLINRKAEKTFYCVGGEDEDSDIVIEVYRDPDFENSYIPVAREFWRCVAFAEPPELQDSDYKDMSDQEDWQSVAEAYKTVCKQIKEFEEAKERYRQEILDLCGDENCSGNGIRAKKTPIRGRVDYDSIPELKTVNLDEYRKKATTSWKVYVA